MISDVDYALRELITDSLSVSRGTVDISFELPGKDWSTRLNRPTINLFLFDIRENLRLRGSEQRREIYRNDATVEVHRNPFRIDLRYLLTAWTKESEDEHLLLSDALITLLRNAEIPEKYLKDSLKNQEFPVLISAAVYQPDQGPTEKVTDIWSVINNDIHAGFIVTITICVNPYLPEVLPAVQTISRNLGQTAQGKDILRSDPSSEKRYNAAFNIRTDKYDASVLQVNLVEQNLMLQPDAQYRVELPLLAEGTYHLDIRHHGKVLKHQTITIPTDDHDIII